MPKGILIILACLGLVFAGCGSDSSSSSTDASTEESAPAKEESAATNEAEASQEEAPAAEAEAATKKPKVKVPSGPPPKQLKVVDLKEGSGPAAKAGDQVTVQYVGVLYKTGEQFDASWDRGEPFTFILGLGEVIPGWDEGIEGMKVGGRRELIVPPELGYGAQQVGTIPPNSTLVFVVDLLAAK